MNRALARFLSQSQTVPRTVASRWAAGSPQTERAMPTHLPGYVELANSEPELVIYEFDTWSNPADPTFAPTTTCVSHHDFSMDGVE
jgi:hypothetical protein